MRWTGQRNNPQVGRVEVFEERIDVVFNERVRRTLEGIGAELLYQLLMAEEDVHFHSESRIRIREQPNMAVRVSRGDKIVEIRLSTPEQDKNLMCVSRRGLLRAARSVVWQKYSREAMQRHHDLYVRKFREGHLSPGDEANFELAMERERAGVVQSLP